MVVWEERSAWGIGEAIGEPQGKKGGGIPGPSPSPISGSGSQVSARSQHQSARSMAWQGNIGRGDADFSSSLPMRKSEFVSKSVQ